MIKDKLMPFVLLTLVLFTFNVVSASSISDRTLGKESAPVTIEMFADFECPFCERWHTETFPLIEENYINEGKVKLIVRHSPLESIHFNSKNAAVTAQCAADQGKFFEYIDVLYNHQDSLGQDSLNSYADDLGLSMEDFDYCVNDPATLDVVNKDLQRADQKGIKDSTPNFFINGKLFQGAYPYSYFEEEIELALSNTASFSCIDINKDRVNDEADIDKLTDYAFRGVEIPEGTNVDLNEDGVVNILDVTMLINYIKRNGPTPSCAIVEPLVVMNSCGDTDGDNTLGQADLDAITSYAFEGVGVPGNVNADLNNDGVVDIVDVVTMTNYVKRDGEKPSCAEKLIVEEPESDVEENIVENPAVPPTGNSGGGSGGSQRTVIIAQNDEIADSTEETTSESEDPVSDTSLEDIEQRLDDLEQKVDENNKILEKILDFLGRFFKF